MGRKKKDEDNYHKNKQEEEDKKFEKWNLEAMANAIAEAMPPAKSRLEEVKKDAEARTLARMAQAKTPSKPKVRPAYVLSQVDLASHWSKGFTTSVYTSPPSNHKKAAMPATKPTKQHNFKKGDKVRWSQCPDVEWTVIRLHPSDPNYVDIEPDPNYQGPHNYSSDVVNHVHLTLIPPPKPRAKVDFDSVIMPDEKRAQILEAIAQIKQSKLIFDDWGFGETIEKGRGVTMLFHGPPGTGKTMVCQAIADKMDYKLVVVANADIQSPAPGQAERNIRKHFEEAADGKTVLLFDECDSLIFSRSHAGPIMAAMVNELLGQIERFNGIVVFTTNRLGTLDEAVNRRLALKLKFDMPSPSERVEIWKRMIPAKAPLADDIDWMVLASIELTGGYIKNAVLRAARMAAAEKVLKRNKKIKMKHLAKALKLEAESMLDFEAAKKKHERGYGYVSRQSSAMDIIEGTA